MENNESSAINIRTPIKILHFSDGILEVFDDEEEHLEDNKQEENKQVEEINEKELSWTPWFAYKARRIGSSVLNGLDYTGEKLADFLGITGPKYAYELKQYQKELARKREWEMEKANAWKVSTETSSTDPITKAPIVSEDPTVEVLAQIEDPKY